MEKKISVAMATYQGEKFIEEQITSILQNLNPEDELIISDDGSTDKTALIIKEYQKKDSRIHLIQGPKLGVKKNFENAIRQTTGDYIFLSDQDDVWKDNKVLEVINCFKEHPEVTLVLHDAQIVNTNKEEILPSFFVYRNCGEGILKNIWKNTYIGCCMAFNSRIKEAILPIPNTIEMHDQWIGIQNERIGKSFFLKEKLILYRRHEKNVSQMKHYGVIKMIKNRCVLCSALIRKGKKSAIKNNNT